MAQKTDARIAVPLTPVPTPNQPAQIRIHGYPWPLDEPILDVRGFLDWLEQEREVMRHHPETILPMQLVDAAHRVATSLGIDCHFPEPPERAMNDADAERRLDLFCSRCRGLIQSDTKNAETDRNETAVPARLQALAAWKTAETGGKDPTKSSDGPFGIDGFRWDGQEFHGLTPQPWRLVCELWKATDRTAEIVSLAETVWNEHAKDIPVTTVTAGTARKAVNAFFNSHALPWKVSICGTRIALVRT